MAQGPINLSLFGSKVPRGTPNSFFSLLVSFFLFFSFFGLVILPFVTEYRPSVRNLKHILMNKWHLIQKQPSKRNL